MTGGAAYSSVLPTPEGGGWTHKGSKRARYTHLQEDALAIDVEDLPSESSVNCGADDPKPRPPAHLGSSPRGRRLGGGRLGVGPERREGVVQAWLARRMRPPELNAREGDGVSRQLEPLAHGACRDGDGRREGRVLKPKHGRCDPARERAVCQRED
jgi:hypothetical protein